ncbi:MAG TPA: hypothetical protein VJU77_17505 [Chthoniobacterales bacterium]|nr:hypothetical protein [Chthoniobacterales bacterium]
MPIAFLFSARPTAASVLVLLLAGCVANQPYRLGGIADDIYAGQKPHFEETMVSSDRSVRLSFVEFDEKGDFWDRRQLGKTSRYIRDAKKPVLLVLFIHGWHHNAADRKPGGKNPGDVETFQRLLAELAMSDSTRHLQVHGVYIGWRGRLVQGPLDYLTFLDRKGAATRVAGTPVTETIFQLIRQARKYHQGSKCVVIGHSFGALVLEKAMAQAMTGSLLAQDVQSRGQPVSAPADLILLVNSAAESIYAKEMKDMFARMPHRGTVTADRPLLISMTSKSDTATKTYFPLGTFLPNLFAHRRYQWDDKYDNASHQVDQNEYLTQTPGHNLHLWSHDTVPSDPPDSASSVALLTRQENATEPPSESNPAFEENLRHPRGLVFATSDRDNPDHFKWWRLTKVGGNPTTPYWVIHVPDEIIHGHAPIFTPEGRAMMAALFRITNPKTEPGARTMTVSD